jgi:hypothetical protein
LVKVGDDSIKKKTAGGFEDAPPTDWLSSNSDRTNEKIKGRDQQS